MNEGTGRTTKQMQDAPQGAIYVWVNAHLKDAEKIAFRAGRTDLMIVPPWHLENDRLRGRTLTGIVVDHAARLTDAQHNELTRLRAHVRKH
jgi:hypothetical protein